MKVSSILERVEKERDDAFDELRRMKGETQSLENQLNVSDNHFDNIIMKKTVPTKSAWYTPMHFHRLHTSVLFP